MTSQQTLYADKKSPQKTPFTDRLIHINRTGRLKPASVGETGWYEPFIALQQKQNQCPAFVADLVYKRESHAVFRRSTAKPPRGC